MATLINRGTRKSPRWYIQWQEGPRTRQRTTGGVPHDEALAQLADFEYKLAHGTAPAVVDAEGKAPRCSALFPPWKATLQNRTADQDRGRVDLYLSPKFGHRRVDEIKPRVIMEWLDELAKDERDRRKGQGRKLSGSTQRGIFGLLSRFFSWCVAEGYVEQNPCRSIPQNRRPHAAPPDADRPWIREDATVRKLINALPEDVGLMFYLANRSGIRLGECAGLRMSDTEFLSTRAKLRVRFSYDGPLKEDKGGQGKVKFPPAPAGWEARLGPWLTRRRAQGAEPESYVFPAPTKTEDGEQCYTKMALNRAWRKAAKQVGVELTWYEATRHSFISRTLTADPTALLDVSRSVGHSTVTTTQRFYTHLLDADYSPSLHADLADEKKAKPAARRRAADGGKLVEFPRASEPPSTAPVKKAPTSGAAKARR